MTAKDKKFDLFRPFGIPKGITITLMIIGALGLFLQYCINSNTRAIEASKTRHQTTQNKTPEKTVRRTECERNNSPDYCHCLIGHVKKNTGYIERHEWLGGAPLTSAKGRKAAMEAVTLCRGL